MLSGIMYLDYTPPNGTRTKISLGVVSAYQDHISKHTTVKPILSAGMENAFPIESSNSRSISLSFSRKNPDNPNDNLDATDVHNSERWSNAHWYEILTAAADRMQLKTDGFNLVFEPSADNPYLPTFTTHGYIKSLTRSYNQAEGEAIYGSMTFSIGSAYVSGAAPPTAINLTAMDLIVSDKNQRNWYALLIGMEAGDLYSQANAVSSVKITGGPQDPLEYATISISRKKLQSLAPELCADNALVGYMNEVRADVMGEHSMILYKASSRGDNLTITAVTKAYIYKLSTLSYIMSGCPFNIIRDILQNTGLGISYNDDDIVYAFLTDNNAESLTFPVGENVFRILQICAITLGCNLWFADDKAYIVDFRQRPEMYTAGTADMSLSSGFVMGGISGGADGTLTIDESLNGRCIGTTEVDGEGAAPLMNMLSIKCSSAQGVYQNNKTIQVTNSYSIGLFKTATGGTLEIPELCEVDGTSSTVGHNQASQFGENYLSYLGECQRSKTITMKELYTGNKWAPAYSGAARLGAIADPINGDSISNMSVDPDANTRRVLPQKLICSSWTRSYPECTTEYTFGIISNIDLPTNTASVSNTLNIL